MEEPKVVKVYSTPECPYCKEIKELLVKENIEFTDVNIKLPENEKEYQKLYEMTKCDEVPIVLVDKQLLVPNVSFQSIQEAADLTKKFLG